MQFSNCSSSIAPVEARQLVLSPGLPTMVDPPPQVYVEDSLASPDRYCWLALYDSQGLVTDRRQVPSLSGILRWFEAAWSFLICIVY